MEKVFLMLTCRDFYLLSFRKSCIIVLTAWYPTGTKLEGRDSMAANESDIRVTTLETLEAKLAVMRRAQREFGKFSQEK